MTGGDFSGSFCVVSAAPLFCFKVARAPSRVAEDAGCWPADDLEVCLRSEFGGAFAFPRGSLAGLPTPPAVVVLSSLPLALVPIDGFGSAVAAPAALVAFFEGGGAPESEDVGCGSAVDCRTGVVLVVTSAGVPFGSLGASSFGFNGEREAFTLADVPLSTSLRCWAEVAAVPGLATCWAGVGGG